QLRRLAAGRVRPDEVERELRAQFAWLAARGVRPTHVDGHHHVHAYPGVLPVVLRLMGEYGVRALRSPLLTAWLLPYLPRPLDAPGARGRRAALLERRGLARAGALLDAGRLARRADPVGATVRAVATAGAGVVELMAHPAWNRDAAVGAAQVRLLTDPALREALARAGVRLVRYDELAAG
ncbi:MAG TPA: ChbG/HpnK family deacetylase, partial [Thermomicrobiales bacterium]|nr:ChbG/HpnK family deacetylase [Thermomicrobiales bacterium]